MGAQNDPTFSDSELAALRRLIVEDSHATWLRKQLRVAIPVVFALVTGGYAFVTWLIPHWNTNPPP